MVVVLLILCELCSRQNGMNVLVWIVCISEGLGGSWIALCVTMYVIDGCMEFFMKRTLFAMGLIIMHMRICPSDLAVFMRMDAA